MKIGGRQKEKCTDAEKNTRFGIEEITTCTLGNGHAQVDIESHARDADSWIVLVGRRQELGVVVMMTMAVRMRVAHVSPRLRRVEIKVLVGHCRC